MRFNRMWQSSFSTRTRGGETLAGRLRSTAAPDATCHHTGHRRY